MALEFLLATAAASTQHAQAAEAPTLRRSGADSDGPVFGEAGTWTVSAGSMAWQHVSYPDNPSLGLTRSTATNVSALLNADVFLDGNWSVGIGATLAWTRSAGEASSRSDKSYSIAARLGRAVPLGPFASLWPQVSLGAGRDPSLLNPGSNAILVASLEMPLLFHPTPHLFVGAGPTLDAWGNQDTQLVRLAGHIVFGGNFGG